MNDVKWLIAQEIPRLRRYALSLTNDPHAADDLVQDCLERAIRKRHLWRGRGSVRNWLYRILFRVFVNQTSRRMRRSREREFDQSAVSLSEPAAQELHVTCQEIGLAMQQLPADQRAALVLTALEGLTYDEAAGVLGIPIGTLRSRLARGRDKLRSFWVDLDRYSDRGEGAGHGATKLRRVK